MPELSVGQLSVSYTTEGEGPPLILLHAATSSALEDWMAQRPLLRDRFRLYLPDARGHAATRWDVDDGWSQQRLVDDALGFAHALGLDRFHVAGFSMGAGTALALAIAHPERLLSATVVAAGVAREPRASVARRIMQPDVIERDDPTWAAQLAQRHDPVQGDGAWKKLMVAIRDEIISAPLPTPEQLRRARLPMLVAVGDRDPWVPVEQAVKLRRQLPDAQLFVAPGTGHVVVAERPAAFNQALAQFLRLSSDRDG